MEIKIKQDKNTKTINILGEIKLFEIEKLEKEFQDIEGFAEIRINLSKVKYADSSLLNLIIRIKRKYPDKKIKIFNPNNYVSELLNVSGIEHIIEIIYSK